MRLQEQKLETGKTGAGKKRVAPVEVAEIEQGAIALQRMFSGSLETRSEFIVAPEVGGRVEKLVVDLADTIVHNQEVARIGDAEFVQAVARAKADLAVAKANMAEAQNALDIANRELKRVVDLLARKVISDSEFDTAKAVQLGKEAAVEVARAQVLRAQASLESANIRLGYTKVLAGWSGEDQQRVVAERLVNEGEAVSANQPLLRIVQLDPITAVIYVTEKDYAQLKVGQRASLKTDAYPDETFSASIERIAPVFYQQTRQARVELKVENKDQRLKPGMYIRASVKLISFDQATLVPDVALTNRNDFTGVFVVNEDGKTVSWKVVKVGIRENHKVQILEPALKGQVLTLGQQLVEQGSAISIAKKRVAP